VNRCSRRFRTAILGFREKWANRHTRFLLLWTMDGRQRATRRIVSATKTAVRAEIVNARPTSPLWRCWWAHLGERMENAESALVRLSLVSFVIDQGASTRAGL
jgi:hypothetical protein